MIMKKLNYPFDTIYVNGEISNSGSEERGKGD